MPHDRSVDYAFTKDLPKLELHAHLSGSISKATLHEIWSQKRTSGLCLDLENPLIALSSMPDIFAFFAVFDQYIYKLINDEAAISQAVHAVIEDFRRDGVRYLELRTTPRLIEASMIDRERYVEIVLKSIQTYLLVNDQVEVHVLLSVDRKMTVNEADEVLKIARSYSRHSEWYMQQSYRGPAVLGLDLCGNPHKGDVSMFSSVFVEAKLHGLHTTVHFAEVPASSTETELTTILSWNPDRLGHVIKVPDHVKQMIQDRNIALELCLSCNVKAKMVEGSYAEHHLGYWLSTANPVALSTDDVGVFESSLSNEYLLAAQYFELNRSDLVALSRRAAQGAFTGHKRMQAILDQFETQVRQDNEEHAL